MRHQLTLRSVHHHKNSPESDSGFVSEDVFRCDELHCLVSFRIRRARSTRFPYHKNGYLHFEHFSDEDFEKILDVEIRGSTPGEMILDAGLHGLELMPAALKTESV